MRNESSDDLEHRAEDGDRTEVESKPAAPDAARAEAKTLVQGRGSSPAAVDGGELPTQALGEPATPGGKTDPLVRLGKFGKYRIIGRIGAGGFGKVYLGHDPVLGRDVAVKTCTSDDERLHRRFLHEAKIAAGLQHPNIVTVYDFGYEGETPFMVQEYLSGEDLSQKIQRESMSLELRIDYLMSIAQGLWHAHEHQVLHRDIKPGNIRVLEDGQVRILDFGIARILNQTTAFTTDGVAMGTVGYLAPEMLNSDQVDERSDIFSYGVLAYELLSYERPFPGETFVRVSYRLLHEEPLPLAELVPTCPPALSELVDRCLQKDPENRFASFREVIAELARLVEDSQGTGAAGLRQSGAVPLATPSVAPVQATPVPATSTPSPTPAPATPIQAPAPTPPRAASIQTPAPTPPPAGHGDLDMLSTAPTLRVDVLRRQAKWRRRRPWLAAAVGLLAGLALVVPRLDFGGGDASPRAAGSSASGLSVPGSSTSESEVDPGSAATDPSIPSASPSSASGTAPAPGSEAESAPARAEPPNSSTGTALPGRPNAGRSGADNAPPPDGPVSSGDTSIQPPDPASGTIPGEGATGEAPPPGASGTQGASPAAAPPAGGLGRDAGGDPVATSPTETSAGSSSSPAVLHGADGAETESMPTAPAPPSADGAEPQSSSEDDSAVNEPDPSAASDPAVGEGAAQDLVAPGEPKESVLPQLIERVPPEYPALASRRRLEAVVTLGVRVDTDGSVVRTLVKSSSLKGMGFEEAAREAARKSRFEPGTEDGQPVAMWTEMVFSFRRSN